MTSLAAFKEVSLWMNAIADAWNRGLMPQAYDDQGSVAVRVECYLGVPGLKAFTAECGLTMRRKKLERA